MKLSRMDKYKNLRDRLMEDTHWLDWSLEDVEVGLENVINRNNAMDSKDYNDLIQLRRDVHQINNVLFDKQV